MMPSADSCADAIRLIEDAFRHRESRHFQIALVGYVLDGRPYPADSLAVSAVNTPGFTRTDDGFTCEGFFPPSLLDADTASHRVEIRSVSGVAMNRVSIEVHCRDVWAVAEFINGTQYDLFMDPMLIVNGTLAFAEEAVKWHESAGVAPRRNPVDE